jgi:hypothetical protein
MLFFVLKKIQTFVKILKKIIMIVKLLYIATKKTNINLIIVQQMATRTLLVNSKSQISPVNKHNNRSNCTGDVTVDVNIVWC